MKTNKPFMTCFGIISLLVSCARGYEPTVDMRGVDSVKYQKDMAICRDYSDTVNAGGSRVTSTLIGAGFGTAAGVILGALTGKAGSGALIGMVLGGLGGSSAGGVGSMERQKYIIDDCLSNRGYNVLG